MKLEGYRKYPKEYPMSQVLASYRSVEASITSIQASSQRQSLAIQVRSDERPSHILNPQEQQIVDEVDISADALKKLEEAQILAQQLQDYLNYLHGHDDHDLPEIKSSDESPSVVIAGRSTNLVASITVGTIKEDTLEIVADFDDDGNLNALSVTKTHTTVKFVQAEIILENRQFYISG